MLPAGRPRNTVSKPKRNDAASDGRNISHQAMGGGTAIGHPLGATGLRLTGTLARILEAKGGRYGCANACVGGGQGVATIIEKESY